MLYQIHLKNAIKDGYRCKLTEGICNNVDECQVLIKFTELADAYGGN